MDAFVQSGFGQFLSDHFSVFFRSSSWQSFLYLAYGWSVCQYHQTIAHYIWLSGGTKSKHFTRYYHFLNLSFLVRLDQLWACAWGLLDSMIDQELILQLVIDDTTRKKSGRKIQGAAWFRNGAGSARQEYRSLWGLNFVYLSLSWSWRGHRLSLPMGLRLYLKPAVAAQLGREFYSRSALARQILDFMARNLAHRTFLVLIDGGYATKAFLRKLPPNVEVLGRFPINSKIYEQPPVRGAKPKAGRPPLKGPCLDSPKVWQENPSQWEKHPHNPQLLIRSVQGIWHSVLPGISILVIAIWRENQASSHSGQKTLEAFFTTDLQIEALELLQKYRQRWEVEISIRDANAFFGLAQDRCRKLDRIYAINSFRILMAALRIIWICTIADQANFKLTRFRPWYIHKKNLSQMDIQAIFEEYLATEGIYPTTRFWQDMDLIHSKDYSNVSRAA